MTKKIGLYKDKKQWRVRWFGVYDPSTGRIKRYSKTFERKADAEKFQEKIKAEFGQGVERDPSNETLKSFADRWLQDKAQLEGIRPATVLLYQGTLARLYEHFGPDRLLRTIDRKEFDKQIFNWRRLTGDVISQLWVFYNKLKVGHNPPKSRIVNTRQLPTWYEWLAEKGIIPKRVARKIATYYRRGLNGLKWLFLDAQKNISETVKWLLTD